MTYLLLLHCKNRFVNLTKYFVNVTKLFGNDLLTKSFCEFHNRIWSIHNKMCIVILTKRLIVANTKCFCGVKKPALVNLTKCVM